MDDHEGAEFKLLMPFVVCESNGGEYEDRSWCAGFECGVLAAGLAAGEPHGGTVRTANVPQLDLLAMRHGFTVQAEVYEDDPAWSTVQFIESTEVSV